jgi:H+/Cl- antiporter ClcA
VTFFVASFFATSFVGATAFVPALLLIVLAEAVRMRRLLYYAVAGAVVGLTSYFGSDVSLRLEKTTDVAPVIHPLQLAAAAGIVGGLVYWLLAGRNAARWRDG